VPVCLYDPTCIGAKSYEALARELIARHNGTDFPVSPKVPAKESAAATLFDNVASAKPGMGGSNG
jgi:hypothetical protein